MRVRLIPAALCLTALALALAPDDADAATAKVSMLDRLGVAQGTAKISLATGAVNLAVTLAPLPATIDTGGTPFQATIYKAYLASSTDSALEIPLGDLYPTAKSKASIKPAFKGDLSKLGFDKVVVVAYSKDGRDSFDVLTGALPTQ